MNNIEDETDLESIRKVIQEYFDGYARAESGRISRIFHPDTRLDAVDGGRLDRTEMRDWLAGLDQRKHRGEIREGRLEIASVDVSGDAALAKAVLSFPKLRFTDYLSLLRLDGCWRIVAKVYDARVAP